MQTMAAPAPASLQDFEALSGAPFELQAGAGQAFSVQLVQVQQLSQVPRGGRQPFSLLFEGPATPVLPQRMYRLCPPRADAFDIFLVPVAADARCARYEAVFT